MSALAALGARHQRLSSTRSFDILHGVVRTEISGELATDDAAPERGLIARITLAASHGMMFVFAASAPRAFWMKNTRPADIPYFDAVRKLTSVQRDVRPCMAILARSTRAPAQRATCWNCQPVRHDVSACNMETN